MDRGAWWATVHGVTNESEMTEQLKNNNKNKNNNTKGFLPAVQLPTDGSPPRGRAGVSDTDEAQRSTDVCVRAGMLHPVIPQQPVKNRLFSPHPVIRHQTKVWQRKVICLQSLCS